MCVCFALVLVNVRGASVATRFKHMHFGTVKIIGLKQDGGVGGKFSQVLNVE